MPMPPRPGGVEMAAMVSIESTLGAGVVNMVTLGCERERQRLSL